MPKAYAYVRFSTLEQSKGDSLRRQTELCEQYAKLHGLELDTTLELRDLGVSAYDQSNIKRGALGEFLKHVENKEIPIGSYLLIESLDRLSRARIMDALPIFLGLLNSGINIATIADNKVYSRNDTNDNWLNLLMSITIMSRSTEESAIKSIRIRQSWDEKREKINEHRITNRCPAWIKPKIGSGGFEIITERAIVVQRIFQMAKDGMGNPTIAKRLNSESIATFDTLKKKQRKTKGWYESYIQKIFESTATYGEFQAHTQRDGQITAVGEPIENYYPAVITKAEWLQVRSVRLERKTRGGIRKGKVLSNLFSGILKCGYCGGTMVMGGYVNRATKTGERNRNRFVACSTARRGLGCKYKQWSYPDLENKLLHFCKSIDFGKIISKTDSIRDELGSLEHELIQAYDSIHKNEKKISRLITDREDSNDETPTSITKRVLFLEDETKILEIRSNDLIRQIEDLKEKIKSASFQQQHIIYLIEQLKTLKDESLHDLRIQIASSITKKICEIRLFPLGKILTDENKLKLHKSLANSGATIEEIEKLIPDMYDEPNTENKTIFIQFTNGSTIYFRNEVVLESSSQNLGEFVQMNEYIENQ